MFLTLTNDKTLQKLTILYCSRVEILKLAEMGINGETLSTFKSCLNAHVANHMECPSSKCGQSGMISLSKLLQGSNNILEGEMHSNFM